MRLDESLPSILAFAGLFRLWPFILALGVGVVLGINLSRKFAASPSADWEKKYRDLHARYRDLTQQMNDAGGDTNRQANRLRQTLWDIQGILRSPESVSPESARAVLDEVETALREAQEPL